MSKPIERLMGMSIDQLKELIHKYKLPIYGNSCSICDKYTCDECEICPACHERELYDVLDEVFKSWKEQKNA